MITRTKPFIPLITDLHSLPGPVYVTVVCHLSTQPPPPDCAAPPCGEHSPCCLSCLWRNQYRQRWLSMPSAVWHPPPSGSWQHTSQAIIRQWRHWKGNRARGEVTLYPVYTGTGWITKSKPTTQFCTRNRELKGMYDTGIQHPSLENTLISSCKLACAPVWCSLVMFTSSSGILN